MGHCPFPSAEQGRQQSMADPVKPHRGYRELRARRGLQAHRDCRGLRGHRGWQKRRLPVSRALVPQEHQGRRERRGRADPDWQGPLGIPVLRLGLLPHRERRE